MVSPQMRKKRAKEYARNNPPAKKGCLDLCNCPKKWPFIVCYCPCYCCKCYMSKFPVTRICFVRLWMLIVSWCAVCASLSIDELAVWYQDGIRCYCSWEKVCIGEDCRALDGWALTGGQVYLFFTTITQGLLLFMMFPILQMEKRWCYNR
eukprot:UN28656